MFSSSSSEGGDRINAERLLAPSNGCTSYAARAGLEKQKARIKTETTQQWREPRVRQPAPSTILETAWKALKDVVGSPVITTGDHKRPGAAVWKPAGGGGGGGIPSGERKASSNNGRVIRIL